MTMGEISAKATALHDGTILSCLRSHDQLCTSSAPLEGQLVPRTSLAILSWYLAPLESAVNFKKVE
jgi:hypothetical protein